MSCLSAGLDAEPSTIPCYIINKLASYEETTFILTNFLTQTFWKDSVIQAKSVVISLVTWHEGWNWSRTTVWSNISLNRCWFTWPYVKLHSKVSSQPLLSPSQPKNGAKEDTQIVTLNVGGTRQALNLTTLKFETFKTNFCVSQGLKPLGASSTGYLVLPGLVSIGAITKQKKWKATNFRDSE